MPNMHSTDTIFLISLWIIMKRTATKFKPDCINTLSEKVRKQINHAFSSYLDYPPNWKNLKTIILHIQQW